MVERYEGSLTKALSQLFPETGMDTSVPCMHEGERGERGEKGERGERNKRGTCEGCEGCVRGL